MGLFSASHAFHADIDVAAPAARPCEFRYFFIMF